jgi:tetratricopeptide (TPR) repeat protein
MDEQSLDSIGILEGTDKTCLEQDYLRHYERVLGGFRNEPIQLLEIGIAGGASLRTWTRFFPKATIIGVDINESCRAFAGDRVEVEIGSQADPEFLARLARTYHPDVIIDDGSHQAEHILLTFDRLFPFLKPGGFYIMEDLHLHYGNNAAQWHRSGGSTPVQHLAAVASGLGANYIEPGCDPMARYLNESVDRVEFIRRAIIVQKREQQADPMRRMTDLWKLAENAGHAANWFELAQILMRNNELDRAEIAAQRAATMVPDSHHYLARLAHVQAMRGNLSAAVDTARKALHIAPHDTGLQSLLAALESRISKSD